MDDTTFSDVCHILGELAGCLRDAAGGFEIGQPVATVLEPAEIFAAACVDFRAIDMTWSYEHERRSARLGLHCACLNLVDIMYFLGASGRRLATGPAFAVAEAGLLMLDPVAVRLGAPSLLDVRAAA